MIRSMETVVFSSGKYTGYRLWQEELKIYHLEIYREC